MKQVLILGLLFAMSFSCLAQSVEIEGQIKVTDMPLENTDELLVTRQGDGTLGTRQASSIMPPSDTIRTFERDMQLAELACSCPSFPAILIESALDNGYTAQDLIDFGVSPSNLLGLVDPLILFENGVSPILLVANGASEELFIGLEYQGGLLFHIDITEGSGIVIYNQSFNGAIFGCEGITLSGLQIEIGTGESNTNILDMCSEPLNNSSIANLALNNVGPGLLYESSYSDWYIPSASTLFKAMTVLGPSDPTFIEIGFPFYSSTDDPQDNTLCRTVIIATPSSNPTIVFNTRTSPQFRTVVTRTVY